MRIVAVAAGVAMLAGACVYLPPDREDLPEPLPDLVQQQDQPRLALLDHVLAAHFADAPEDAPTTCVAVHDGRSESALAADEETMLMERHAMLAPLSRCAQQGGRWIDADSEDGAEASVVALHSFTCASTTGCTGWAAAQTGAAASPSYRYTMDWDGKQWRFTRNPRLIAD